MFRIMIVDDEIPALDYLENLVEYTEYGFSIVCRARSGAEGLKMYEKFRPDLIIADVVMPGMTGLEMADRILEGHPECMIILLTAYSEFEYAKQAVTLGVKSYILKHELYQETLIPLLEKMRDKLQRQQTDLELKKWSQYARFFSGNECDREKLEREYQELCGIQNVLILVQFIQELPGIHEGRVAECQRMQAGYREESGKNGICALEILSLQKNQAVMLLSSKKNLSHAQLSEQILSVGLYVIHSISEEYGISAYVGISENTGGFDGLFHCHQAASEAVKASFFKPQNTLFFAGRVGVAGKESEQARRKLVEEIDTYAKVRDVASLERALKSLMLEVHVQLSRNECFLSDMETVVGILYRECGISVRELYGAMEKSANVNEAYERIKNLLEERYVSLKENYSPKIVSALNCIHQNLERPVTLVEVAEEVQLNSAYLSQLFKKELGMSFKTYVNQKRIERAEELLKTGDYKIYEISEKLGFQTVQHFNHTFRKITGHTPGEYKN